MNRIFKALLAIYFFIICPLVFASDEARKLSIFFCTCDLGSSESKGQQSDKSLVNNKGSFIVLSKSDDLRHKQLRHCFVLLAAEVSGILKNKLVLDMVTSAGYYYNSQFKKGVVYGEDSWLLNPEERKKYTVSCTPVVQEGTTGINKADPNSKITETEVEEIWDKIYVEMRENARSSPLYDRDTHNCCTVAFDSLRKIRDSSKNFSINLSHIKKRTFNMLGRGIAFDWNDDSVLHWVEGGGRLLTDTMFLVPKVAIGAFRDYTGSEYVEAEHDNDKVEL